MDRSPRAIIREATTDDARLIAHLYATAEVDDAPQTAPEVSRMLQTGSRFLIVERKRQIVAACRAWTEEGIGWLGWLVSARPWAGADLVRAVQRECQDAGIRVLRMWCPDLEPLPEYFGRLGYLPAGSRETESGRELLLERRLPLLTVREQRRTDAEAIAALLDEDPWLFEQGARPGWFVLSDGDRVVGALNVADEGGGLARVRVPLLVPAYRGRKLELWMLDRAAFYAETNGYHSAEVAAEPLLNALKPDLEDRRWFREGDTWRRVFFVPPSEPD